MEVLSFQNYSATSFFTVACIITAAYLFARHRKIDLPGPPIWFPVLGHLYYFLIRPPAVAIMDLAKKYGPMYYVELGLVKTIIISDYAIAKEALVSKGRIYSSRPKMHLFSIATGNQRSLAASPYNDHWKKLRKQAQRLFSNANIGDMDLLVDNETSKLAYTCLEAAEKNITFCPIQSFYNLTMNVILMRTFGRVYSDVHDPEFVEISKRIDEIFKLIPVGAISDMFPPLQHFPNYNAWKLMKKTELFHTFIMHQMNLVRKEITYETENKVEKTAKPSFAKELLLNMTKENLTDENVKLFLADMVLAGVDTTASTLGFAIPILINHPHVQDLVFEEIENFLERKRLPQWSDQDNLPYTCATIKEIVRYNPVGLLAMPHENMEDDVLAGHFIPKGTQVIFNVTGINQSMYKDQPDYQSFNPGRFAHDEHVTAELNKGVFTFSDGRRVCPGVPLAQRELFSSLSKLLYLFKFESADGQPIPKKVSYGLTITPAENYNIKLVPRFPEARDLLHKSLGSTDIGNMYSS